MEHTGLLLRAAAERLVRAAAQLQHSEPTRQLAEAQQHHLNTCDRPSVAVGSPF
jgi:hypothetical protein